MLPTWTLVIFLSVQPFVFPQTVATLEECSRMEMDALSHTVPGQASGSCARTDLSVYKPASAG